MVVTLLMYAVRNIRVNSVYNTTLIENRVQNVVDKLSTYFIQHCR